MIPESRENWLNQESWLKQENWLNHERMIFNLS